MPNVISSVKALLLYQGKFLFLKETLHKGDIWDLPGGKIEYGEEPEAALEREVWEELHIKITIKRSVGVWWFYSQNSRHQVICHTFLCEPMEGFTIDTNQNPADEHFDELRWMSRDEALASSDLQLTPSLRKLLANLEID